MSASSMAEQGKKTEAKVLKALGKKPKTAQEVAEKVGVSRGAVVTHLRTLVMSKQATQEKLGRSYVYALPAGA